ncbi:MAG: helix-turn-helix transcriptional regulator [Clostridia bacterium]
MNQKKIGSFMKELRKEKQITQEELSEILGVSNRTISRWETGNNMPDIVLLLEISDYYDVDIKELLNGERKNEDMDKNTEKTVLKVAEYDNEEKLKMITKLNRFSLVGIFTMTVYLILIFVKPNETPFTDFVTGFMLGISLATIIINAIFTSKYGAKIKAFKLRVLEKNK